MPEHQLWRSNESSRSHAVGGLYDGRESEELAAGDAFFNEFVGKQYRGNMGCHVR